MLRTHFHLILLISLSLFMVDLGATAQSDNEAILAQLRDTVVSVDYTGRDFDEIIDELRESHDLNIHVSWRKLEEHGVRRDQRMEITLSNVSLATLLQTLLREVQPNELDELAYQIENGMVVISSRDALAQTRILRSYSVMDFFESGYADRRFFTTPSLALAITGNETVGGENTRSAGGGSGGGFGGGGGGGNTFDGGGDPPLRISDMERSEELIDMLITMVTPDEWEDNGGLTASVRYFQGQLFILHTINGHYEIERFFKTLRESRPEPLDATALIVRVRSDRIDEWKKLAGESFPRISHESFDDVVAAVDAQSILFRGTTSGFNGRRLWFSALTQRDLLVGMSNVTGTEVASYEPKSGFSTEGLELIALPLVTPGTDQLQLDINLAWIPAAQIEERSVRLGPDSGDATIDQLTRTMRTVSTAIHMSIGDAIALTIPNELPETGVAPEYEDWLIIQVRSLRE